VQLRPRGRIGLNDDGRLKTYFTPVNANSSLFLDLLPVSGIMISPILRRAIIQTGRQSRCFSSSPISTAQEVKRLGVIGAGQMVRLSASAFPSAHLTKRQGLGIALVAAQKAGVPVTLVDTNQASIDKGLKFAGKMRSFYLTPPKLTCEFRKAFGQRCLKRTDHTRAIR
jgi:hypothetical protein